MRIKYTVFHLFFFCSSVYGQQPFLEWNKDFGGSNFQDAKAILNTDDGGYLVAGSSNSDMSGDKSDNSIGNFDIWILKLRFDGVKEWDKTIGGNSYDDVSSLIKLSDGNYLIVGDSWSNSSGNKTQNSRGLNDFWVIKLSTNGTIIWEKTFGGSESDRAIKALETPENDIIVVGTSASSITGDKTQNSFGSGDIWAIKLNHLGQKIWDKSFGGSNSDECVSISATIDGNFLISGNSNSNISGTKSENSIGYYDFWITKISTNGNYIWDKTIGGNSLDYVSNVICLSNGDFLLGGESNSNISGYKSANSLGGYDFWVIKIDINRNKIWDRTYQTNGYDDASSFISTNDGFFILSGRSDANSGLEKSQNSKGGFDFWTLKLDIDGNKVWDKTYGGNDNEFSYGSCVDLEGNICLVGSSYSNTSFNKSENLKGGRDYWILKINYCMDNFYHNIVPTYPNTYQVKNTIQSSISIQANSLYRAGHQIILMPGFKADNVIFEAKVFDCPNE